MPDAIGTPINRETRTLFELYVVCRDRSGDEIFGGRVISVGSSSGKQAG